MTHISILTKEVHQMSTGASTASNDRQKLGIRFLLIATLVLGKLAYIGWYYASGIGLNLGDTAQYVNQESAEEFYSRSGGIGFAYVTTLLFSVPALRICIELFSVLVTVLLVRKLQSNGAAFAAVTVFLLPTSLAFLTVASKEVLIFLVLLVALRARPKYSLPALALTVILKPTFALVAGIMVIRRAKGLTLYYSFTLIAIVFVLFYSQIEKFYRKSFYEYWPHFKVGDLTHPDEGTFPASPVIRTIGVYSLDAPISALVISFSLIVSHAIMLIVLRRSYGGPRGFLAYLLVILAMMPYSIFNLGSAARYQAPLICAVLLVELLRRPAPVTGVDHG